MSEPLSSQYDPKTTEPRLYREWEANGYFRAEAGRVLSGERQPYVIVIPPPNVTAPLHMGHGLNDTIQDMLIRWRRMQGYEALWVPGTDHAGIATQNVVERQLAEEGKTRDDVGRAAFVRRVWGWVDQTGARILDQLRSMGCSFDGSRTAFTLDERLSAAVREVFVRLYEKGLIYRGNYIINWCPRCRTALSDEEAEPTETQGKLWHLRYPLVAESAPPAAASRLDRLEDGRPYLVVATTRPETMLGDVAVAVHPADARYADLIGAQVELPLTGRRIPVVADEWVDPEFGSGAVKVTPAHDPNDFEIGRRHELPSIDVMTPTGLMSENVPEPFRGLDRFEARARVVDAFRELGLLGKVEAHMHAVPHCYRCDTVVEPRLSLQWFVKMKPLAEPALAASRDGRVRFHPEHYRKIYEHWLENIRDWCISRQLWWGHRIPVWYCRADDCEEIVVARETPERCPRCGGTELEQDPDVLDTWFSSQLWPFSTLGWPAETDDLAAFYPTSTLVTGADIIFFWVARMIMSGIEFMGEAPFTDVYLNGIVRDHLGRKMSKSLGNGIDPLHVVELFGADALRYTVVAGSAAGTDIFLNYEDLEKAFAPGRNFANKIWNAGRFALMNLPDRVSSPEEVVEGLALADRWILSRLEAVIGEVTAHLEAFRMHEAAQALHRFFWSELADWYVELVKPRLRDDAESGDDGAARRAAAQATLVEVLDLVLRLLHPLMPFVSEALWQRLPERPGPARPPSLVIADWPGARPERRDTAAEQQMDTLMELIGAVRAIRSDYDIAPGSELELHLESATEPLLEALGAEQRALAQLARCTVIDGRAGSDGGKGAHAVLRDGTGVTIPLEGVIDIERERVRLSSEKARLENQAAAVERRLENRDFLEKAPAEVVQRERDKLESFREQTERLTRKLTALA